MNYLFPKTVGFFRDDHSVYVDIKNVPGKRQSILLDCGNNHTLSTKDFLRIKTIFISHAHIDHMIGFDNVLRMNLREDKRICVVGPEPMSNILHHRLQGYMWNLIYDSRFEIEVWDITPRTIKKYLLRCCEGFSKKHFIEKVPAQNPFIQNDYYQCRFIRLDHDIPSIGYSIQETDRLRVRKKRLRELNLPEGQWIKQLKNRSFAPDDTMEVNGDQMTLQSLYDDLITHEPGFKISYITDTILNEKLKKTIPAFVDRSDHLYCEATFLHDDLELARQFFHLTARQTGWIATTARVKQLFIIHLSLRYPNPYMILNEAQEEFPKAQFPLFSDTCMVKRKV